MATYEVKYRCKNCGYHFVNTFEIGIGAGLGLCPNCRQWDGEVI